MGKKYIKHDIFDIFVETNIFVLNSFNMKIGAYIVLRYNSN